ncbi:hypothetical protein BJX61DRAFT_509520 [Aspergillus egyptiacus]|nr:hypothetical protein BJX61DRAFT_509520 [Aspergillus egyptiacus]
MSTMFSQNMSQSLMPLPLREASHYQNPMLDFERQVQRVQRDLQHFIDAQSEGLFAGLGGQQPVGSVSGDGYASFLKPEGSVGSSVPVPQRSARDMGLHAARRNISRAMYFLSSLRRRQEEELICRLKDIDLGLSEIQSFNTKQTKLEQSISAINDNKESHRSKELRDERHRLEEEIHDLENKLSQKKARHYQVVEELSHIGNVVESKLSSYKASLSLLESNVRKFLKDPPLKPWSSNTSQESFYSLKPSRRTLDMAQEHWEKERTQLQLKQDEVAAEFQALEEGCEMWKQVVDAISGFEKRLRDTMSQALGDRSPLLPPDGPSSTKVEADMIRSTMEDLNRTTNFVEEHLDYAQEKNWKLLICCISAELEALREGRDKLLDVFNITEDAQRSTKPSPDDRTDNKDRDSPTDHPGDDDSPPADLLKSVEIHPKEAAPKSDIDDDEPDPAWLLPET